MAFSQVAAINNGNNNTDSTSHTINLPSGISAGNLLLAFLAFDGTPLGVGGMSGWTLLDSETGQSPTTRVYYKIATGSEGSTDTFSISVAERSAHITHRITGWHGTTPPAISVVDTTTTNPNPPSLNPSGWDVEDTLWIALGAWDNGSIALSAYPTGATGLGNDRSNSSTGVGVATAKIESATASVDPNIFTLLSASSSCQAYTIAVRPNPNVAPYIPSNLTPSGNVGSASGVLTADVSDPNGDPIASVTIELYDETAAAYVTGYTDVSPQVVTTGLEDGVMTKDATSVLTIGHAYRWRAKASDGLLTSAFSSWAYFTYGVAPVVVLTEPDPAEVITTAGLPITFTYSHVNAKIADRVLLQKLTGSTYVTSYDSGWVGTEGSPQNRTSITLPTGTLRNQESYQIKVFAKASGGFEGDTGFVEFSVAYTGPAALTPTATPSASRAEVLVDWPTSALADVDFAGYEVAVGDPTGTVSTANKTIVFYTSDKTLSQYTYPFPVSGESKGYYVRQIQVIGPDLVEGNWTRVTATCDFGDRIFIKSVQDPYTLLFDFEVLRRSLPTQAKTASQQFIRTWGRAVPVELLGEGREATGSIDIPFYDSATFAQSAAVRAALFEQIEAIRGTVALLLSVPTKRKEFAAIEGEVTLELDDNLKYRASLNWRRVDYSEDYYA